MINLTDLETIPARGSQNRRYPEGKHFREDPEVLYQGQEGNPKRYPHSLYSGISKNVNVEEVAGRNWDFR